MARSFQSVIAGLLLITLCAGCTTLVRESDTGRKVGPCRIAHSTVGSMDLACSSGELQKALAILRGKQLRPIRTHCSLEGINPLNGRLGCLRHHVEFLAVGFTERRAQERWLPLPPP